MEFGFLINPRDLAFFIHTKPFLFSQRCLSFGRSKFQNEAAMPGLNDLTDIHIAVHRLAIDSVKIPAALFIDFPLHGKYGILYALDSLLKVVFHSKIPS